MNSDKDIHGHTALDPMNLVLRVESSRDVGDDDLLHPQQLHHPHREHGLGGDMVRDYYHCAQ